MLPELPPLPRSPAPPPRVRRAILSPTADTGTLATAPLSARDDRILALTRRKLHGPGAAFDEALRALREAVEELIPAGRVYLLGATDHGPIVGSLVSGVGIASGEGSVILLRVDGQGRRTRLGSLVP